MKKNVYIIGSKGIPAKYGGFETFVEKLTENQKNHDIQYHIACMLENSLKSNITEKHFKHNNAYCFNIDVPNLGPAKAIYYDIASLNYAIKLAEKNNDSEPIFYILACRIGPFIKYFEKKIKKINGKLFVNPDGHEWLREKWSYPVRKYWKLSERLMVKFADLLICDSISIEEYIKKDYKIYNPETTYIAYGTDLEKTLLNHDSKKVTNWYKQNKLSKGEYYLVVGRFVPENNYEIMIRSFMESRSKKDFILITNIENNKFYEKLRKKTKFENDSRIKFVGTVYDQDLLKYIRENAFAYIHGHEVGGTNPSLLEALSSTKVNLLLNVGFNKEVGKSSAIYWNKDNLSEVINQTENESLEYFDYLNKLSNERVKFSFSWDKIISEYEQLIITGRR